MYSNHHAPFIITQLRSYPTCLNPNYKSWVIIWYTEACKHLTLFTVVFYNRHSVITMVILKLCLLLYKKVERFWKNHHG